VLVVDLKYGKVSKNTFGTVVNVRIWRVLKSFSVLSGQEIDLISHIDKDFGEASLICHVPLFFTKVLNCKLINKILKGRCSVDVLGKLLIPEHPLDKFSHRAATSIPSKLR
jgi:hypothetical protein